MSKLFSNILKFDDLIFEVLKNCFTPKQFYSLSLINKKFAKINKNKKLQNYVMDKYKKLIIKKDKKYYILPNGERYGEYKEWWSTGELFEHCFYKNGKKHGEFKKWYENGKLIEHEFYRNGIKIFKLGINSLEKLHINELHQIISSYKDIGIMNNINFDGRSKKYLIDKIIKIQNS